MKDITYWQAELTKELSRHDGLTDLSANRLLDVELGLFLLRELLPTSPALTLPGMLSGFEFPYLERQYWTGDQERFLSRARLLIGQLRHRTLWQDLLEKYIKVPELLRVYTVDDNYTSYAAKSVSILPNRLHTFRQTLAQPIPGRKQSVNWAEIDREYNVDINNLIGQVVFPSNLVVEKPKSHSIPSANRSIQTIQPTKDELIEIGRWMDDGDRLNNLPSQNWADRIEKIQLENYDERSQSFLPSDRLTINGTTNVVGMLSSRKSTLMMALAVWAAKKGLRVTLLVGDVSDVLNQCNYLSRLGLPAAPLLGKSNRDQHLTRLHTATAERSPFSTDAADIHRGFSWLSTACMIPVLMKEEPILREDDYKRPCLSLRLPGQSTTHACPLYAKCSYHNAQRDLVDAKIWVGTPASLLYTRADQQLTASKTQLAELICKTSDLIIIDEADRVQVQFDLAFSPGQVLVDDTLRRGWLDSLNNHIRSVQERSGRGIRSDATISTFRRMIVAAHDACERLYDLLISSEGKPIKEWVHKQQYFTGWLLFDQLADTLLAERPVSDVSGKSELPEVFDKFVKNHDPLGENTDSALATFAQKVIAQDQNRSRLHREIMVWLVNEPTFTAELAPEALKDTALKLEFVLLLSVLENRLSYIIRHWKQAEATFDLADWGSNLFNEPPKEYLSLIPISAAGNVLAFRYESLADKPGQLTFFKNMGTGRYALLNLHRLYQADSDVPEGQASGPNVLLLSGTSWAGTSPSYHLQIPVDSLLRSPEKELSGVTESQFYYYPLRNDKNEPIRVSGRSDMNDRKHALEELVQRLAERDEIGETSLLESHLLTIDEKRRRALLIVGSYYEAQIVRDKLIEVRSNWKGRVVALAPDGQSFNDGLSSQQEILLRSKVQQFAQSGAFILIAPLLAIERGHNILNDLNQAALGAAYFLVRPHPHPGDIGMAVKMLNHWALNHHTNSYWFERQHNGQLPEAGEMNRIFRKKAIRNWNRYIRMRVQFPTMPETERNALYWDQLVSIWQVIGRLIRGGVSAQVYFCDAAFAPNTPLGQPDTVRSSLLVGMRELLRPYFDETSSVSARDRAVAQALYQPFFHALLNITDLHHEIPKPAAAGLSAH
ncbi:pPIWI_RE_Z domain-containing protein [Spirosoma fluviale]|nr:hypothetical protein [Spirosoma fluviale]